MIERAPLRQVFAAGLALPVQWRVRVIRWRQVALEVDKACPASRVILPGVVAPVGAGMGQIIDEPVEWEARAAVSLRTWERRSYRQSFRLDGWGLV